MSEKSIKETALSAFKSILDATYDGNPNRAETLKKCYLIAHDAAVAISKMGEYREIVPGSADDRLHSLELIAGAARILAMELVGEPLPNKTYESWCELSVHLRNESAVNFCHISDHWHFEKEIDAYLKRKGVVVPKKSYGPPPLKERTMLEKFKNKLDSLTDEERLELFGRYCRGCGCVNVRDESGQLCHCQDDE